MDERFYDAIHELAEQASIAVQSLSDALQDTFQNALNSAIDVLSEVTELISDCIERTEKIRKEREKWKLQKSQKLRPLLLDKRSKIHRCRNCC